MCSGSRGDLIDTREYALIAARSASNKLADDILILDVGDIISITDYFVLASAGNPRQVRSIVDEIEARLKTEQGVAPRAIEGLQDNSWVLMDYGFMVVHVFLEETRSFYDLERLWADAERVDWGGPRLAAL
jgi:ribosome-associated protein